MLHLLITVQQPLQGASQCGYACSLETGNFFALDMGGTNFRTVHVKLSGQEGHTVQYLFGCVAPASAVRWQLCTIPQYSITSHVVAFVQATGQLHWL